VYISSKFQCCFTPRREGIGSTDPILGKGMFVSLPLSELKLEPSFVARARASRTFRLPYSTAQDTLLVSALNSPSPTSQRRTRINRWMLFA